MRKELQPLTLKIACGAVILSLFLNWYGMKPYLNTGLRLLFGNGMRLDFLPRVAIILLPVSIAAILYFHIAKKDVYPFQRKLFLCIPAALVALFYLGLHSQVSALVRGLNIHDLLSAGFWLALLASCFIAYLGFQKEK